MRTLLLCLAVGMFAACSGEAPPPPSQPAAEGPYEFVDTKAERYATADAYAAPGEIDRSQLANFCRERYETGKGERFYMVFLFDGPENVGWPSVPLTAGYEHPRDAGLARHVRAECWFNRLNGIAKLTYYSENSYDSVGITEVIP